MTTDDKIKKFIVKWKDTNFLIFNEGKGAIPQIYKDFENEYKDVLKSICNDINFSIKKFYPGYFEFCGILQNNENGRLFDVAIPDVTYDSFIESSWSADISRCTEHNQENWCDSILYRVRDDKRLNSSTFSPGLHGNHYAHLEQLGDNLVQLDKQWTAYERGQINKHEIEK